MELEAAGKELVRRVSVAAQRLDEGCSGPSDDMESLLLEVKAHLDPSDPTGQNLLDIVGMDMPSILVKFAIIPHGSCGRIVESILKTLLESCDPRDMFAAYMEALYVLSEPETLALCTIILDGLPKIFTRLRRRRVEYFKESFPGLLKIAGLAMDTDQETWTILDKLVRTSVVLLDIAAQEEVKEQRESLDEAVGIFILLLLARFSAFEQLNDSVSVQSLLVRLAKLIPTCGMSYSDMITGSRFESIIESMRREDILSEGGYILDARQGAVLTVWWRFCFGETAIDNQEVMFVVDGVRSSRHGFVSALSNVLVLLTSKEKSWKKVEIGIDLLSIILEWGTTPSVDNPLHIQLELLEPNEFLKLKELLQVVHNVVIFFPQSRTRQHAYNVLVNIVRKVLPPVERFKALKQLIIECEHSSMVLSVLNLYRFLLIKEKTGKSNYTGVLLNSRLQEACSKWFRPLCAVLEGFKRDCLADDSEVTASVLLSVSNLEGVLYRCLELAEAALREHSS